MQDNNDNANFRNIGAFACRTTFVAGIIYAITTVLGFLSLNSNDEPIRDPWFAAMEILTILIAFLMVISMAAVHYYAAQGYKIFSLAALLFMMMMVGITSSVHFVLLTAGRSIDAAVFNNFPWLFSFKWPSVVYALDVLAWDWFFALSMFLAAPVFNTGKLEKMVRMLMVVCGCLSLAGLAGAPLKNMQVRNIGIVGYAIIAPFAFLLIAKVLRHKV